MMGPIFRLKKVNWSLFLSNDLRFPLDSDQGRELYLSLLSLFCLGTKDELDLFLKRAEDIEAEGSPDTPEAKLIAILNKHPRLRQVLHEHLGHVSSTWYRYMVSNFWSGGDGSRRLFVEQLDHQCLKRRDVLVDRGTATRAKMRELVAPNWFAPNTGLSEADLDQLDRRHPHFMRAKYYWQAVWRLYNAITNELKIAYPDGNCSTFNAFIVDKARATRPVIVAWGDIRPPVDSRMCFISTGTIDRLRFRSKTDIVSLVDDTCDHPDQLRDKAKEYVTETEASLHKQIKANIGDIRSALGYMIDKWLAEIHGEKLKERGEEEALFDLRFLVTIGLEVLRYAGEDDHEPLKRALKMGVQQCDVVRETLRQRFPNTGISEGLGYQVIDSVLRLQQSIRWFRESDVVAQSKDQGRGPIYTTLLVFRPLLEFYRLWGGNCFASYPVIMPGADGKNQISVLSTCSDTPPTITETQIIHALANELFITPTIEEVNRRVQQSTSVSFSHRMQEDMGLVEQLAGDLKRSASEGTTAEAWTEFEDSFSLLADLIDLKYYGSRPEPVRHVDGSETIPSFPLILRVVESRLTQLERVTLKHSLHMGASLDDLSEIGESKGKILDLELNSSADQYPLPFEYIVLDQGMRAAVRNALQHAHRDSIRVSLKKEDGILKFRCRNTAVISEHKHTWDRLEKGLLPKRETGLGEAIKMLRRYGCKSDFHVDPLDDTYFEFFFWIDVDSTE